VVPALDHLADFEFVGVAYVWVSHRSSLHCRIGRFRGYSIILDRGVQSPWVGPCSPNRGAMVQDDVAMQMPPRAEPKFRIHLPPAKSQERTVPRDDVARSTSESGAKS